MLTIFVCMGAHCEKRGAQLLAHRLAGLVRAEGLSDEVHVENDYCQSNCLEGPVVRVESRSFTKVQMTDVEAILSEVRRQLHDDRPTSPF